MKSIKQFTPRTLHFALIEYFFWSANSAYYVYLVVYLRSINMAPTSIGMIMSINSFLLILAQPFWGYISDKLKTTKYVFIACFSISVLLVLTVPLYTNTVILVAVLALITFFESPLMSLMDTWIIGSSTDDNKINYGRARLLGSLGFGSVSLFVGYATDILDIRIVFPLYTILAVVVISIAFRFKETRTISSKKIKLGSILSLIKMQEYMIFVVLAALLFIPHRASMIFMPDLVQSLGGTNSHYGAVFFMGSISEIPIFFVVDKFLKKYDPRRVILVSLLFFTVRQFMYSIASAPYQLLIIQMMQGLSFALFISSTVYYINKIAPQDLKATAQAFASSMFTGLGAVIGSFFGGLIIENYSVKYLFRTGTIISLIVLITFYLTIYKKIRGGDNGIK